VVPTIVRVLVEAAEGFAMRFGRRSWLGVAGGVSRRCTSMTNASASPRLPSETALRRVPQTPRHDDTHAARL
jgi:hypothetical protein